MKNCSCKPNSSSNLSQLNKHSQDKNTMISKLKPKVRIIHIFAPEIIKTDVANFRELVQRLTGKPDDHDHDHHHHHQNQFNIKKIIKKKKKKKSSPNKSVVHDHDDEQEEEEKVEELNQRDNYEIMSWGRMNNNDQEYGENGFLDVFDEFMQTNSDLAHHVYDAPLH